MTIEIPKQQYSGIIKEHVLGSGKAAFTIGGETAFPFYVFEGQMPHQPRIALQVLDYAPEDWPEAVKEPYRDVIDDPVAWARKAQDVYKADMIHLWLKSTDPNGLNRSSEEAARTALAVAEAVRVPLIVWGTTNIEKDAELLKQVVELCAGKDIIIGPVQEENHKQLGAMAIAFNVRIIANTPIDINLAKQLNILLSNVGVPIEKTIIDPTTGGLGYGLEYTFSVMERIRQAALTQNDEKLQCPFFCNLAEEVWKTKEAKLPSDMKMGDVQQRGMLMEAVTAVTLLHAGADILVMRHPEAVNQVRRYLATLAGFQVPVMAAPVENKKKTAKVKKQEAAPAPSKLARSLKEGALCKIVQIMDMPVDLAPGYAIALIKSIDENEAEDGIVLGSRQEATKSPQPKETAAVQPAPEGKKPAAQPEFKPAANWSPNDDAAGNYDYQLETKKDFSGEKVSLIDGSYDPGSPQEKHDWRAKVDEKQEMLKQVKTSLRYWYSEGYGSEKRKKPA